MIDFTWKRVIILVLAMFVSLIVAKFVLKFFDNTKANLSTRKIIGSTQDKVSISEYILKLLSRLSFNKEETKNNLIKAGIHNDVFSQVYYLIKIVPTVISLFVVLFLYFTGEVKLVNCFIYFSITMVFCLIVPDMYISMRSKNNISHISGRLPFLLDLMNICVHTGMTLEASLEYLAGELKMVDTSLAFVVKKTSERSKIIGLDKALGEFSDLVPTNEARSFVMTLTQSLKYGSSVGPVLASLASDIREINMLQLEEKIGKMGAKMSIPMIVFIMVPIVILIAAPGIMRMLG
ncbi:type II secretion system F family protein [Vibrio genomosp. F6]|uniref:type II secretion system F family protein n=1 Tax=Vibrio genomosp. F6 TaxID=723172 RepID=UPI00037DA22B